MARMRAQSSAYLSRPDFLSSTIAASAAMSLGGLGKLNAAEAFAPPIVVFSKVYQSLKLDFAAAAEVTAEAGLNGLDAPVRPGGEVLPERVVDDLPRYAEALQKRNLNLPLLTTAITSVSSPHAEELLRTAKKLGVQYYRVGFVERNGSPTKQIPEVKAQLKELAALNQTIGIGGLVQNHSPSGHTYLGGDLGELEELVAGLDPAQIGVAFDIGHALIVHGDGWRPHFERLKAHFRIAYIKDAKRDGRWVPFGQGDVAKSGYFGMLRQMGYKAPISLHMEYDWTQNGKASNREELVKALRESAGVLRQWLARA